MLFRFIFIILLGFIMNFKYFNSLTTLLSEPFCADLGASEDSVCVPHASTLRIKSFDSLNTQSRSSKAMQPQYRSLVSYHDNDNNTCHE